MRIVTFNSRDAILNFNKQLSELVMNSTSSEDFAVTAIYKHQTLNLWWMNYDDFITYSAGKTRQVKEELDKQVSINFNDLKQLEDDGYLLKLTREEVLQNNIKTKNNNLVKPLRPTRPVKDILIPADEVKDIRK